MQTTKYQGMIQKLAIGISASTHLWSCGVHPSSSSRTATAIQPTESDDQTVQPTPVPGAKTLGLSSEEAYKVTVYPIVTANCGNCHRANGPSMSVQPYFASLDPKEAHTFLMSAKKVDLKELENSRLYQRLKDDRHQCWSGDCEVDAAAMLTALTDWVAKIEQPTDDPASTGLQTAALMLSQAEKRDASADPNTILIEGETGTFTAPMAAAADAAASGGRFIQAPNNGQNQTLAVNAANAGVARFTFNVTNPGTYTVFGLAFAANANDQSFYIGMDAGTPVPWILPVTTTYAWGAANNNNAALTFNLSPGSHTLVIRQRQDGTRLDRLAVTTYPGFTGPPKNGIVQVLRYDLSAIAKKSGVSLEVEVEDFDQNTLKFKNPRIVTTTPVKVAGLHLIVNGQDDPRFATYTIIDTTVQPPGALLSQAAMIVLPDLGKDQDKFAIRFDTLE